MVHMETLQTPATREYETEVVVHCPLCNGLDHKEVAARGILKKGGPVVALTNVCCISCGMVFANPRPTPEAYKKLYTQDYAKERGEVSVEEQQESLDRLQEKDKGKQIREFLQTYLSDAAVCIIGAGWGFTAGSLKDHVSHVQAVEPSQEQAAYIKTRGIDVFNGDLSDFHQSYEGEKFDIIIMHHVFEHFTAPKEALQKIKSLLKPEGVIYIEVPNVVEFNKPVDHFFDILHPLNFSPATLSHMLRKAGCKIIAHNSNKPTRIQVVAARSDHPGDAVDDSVFSESKSLASVSMYLNKRRLRDFLYNIKQKFR